MFDTTYVIRIISASDLPLRSTRVLLAVLNILKQMVNNSYVHLAIYDLAFQVLIRYLMSESVDKTQLLLIIYFKNDDLLLVKKLCAKNYQIR